MDVLRMEPFYNYLTSKTCKRWSKGFRSTTSGASRETTNFSINFCLLFPNMGEE